MTVPLFPKWLAQDFRSNGQETKISKRTFNPPRNAQVSKAPENAENQSKLFLSDQPKTRMKP